MRHGGAAGRGQRQGPGTRALRQVAACRQGPLLVPSPVMGEIGYLLQSRVGPQAEVTFLRSFGDDGFRVAEVNDGDVSRMAELVEAYQDLPLGIVDAAVIAIAERLRLAEVATLDRRHFSVVKPRHVAALTLLPGDDE